MRFPLFILVAFLSCFCVSRPASAQLCNGSLGDPVVNITFGSGTGNANGGYAPPNTYTYTSSSCPNDGSYTITSSTFNCFGNTWHNIPGDHTGNGNFMLVNASIEPGDFFLQSVTDLCPNTTYEFASWLMNVQSTFGITPNVTFSVEKPDGTILGQYMTGNIQVTSQPQWNQYGFFFTTPSDNAVIVLRMTNNAPGGNGNDIALDDITFRPCGPAITASIQGYPDTVNICEGYTEPFTFSGSVAAGFLLPVYQWQVSIDSGKNWQDIAGATATIFIRQPTTKPGLYIYRLTVSEQSAAGILACRIVSNNGIINIQPTPYVNAGPDRIIIKGDTLQLHGVLNGQNLIYSWSPPDYLSGTNELNIVATPLTDITYTLSAASDLNCKNADQVYIKVINGIYVPTAFTPNNDGKNDKWKIPYLDPATGATVSVFNRSGEMVYHAEGVVVSWDGTLNGSPQPAATYVYFIRFRNERPLMKGTVTIIR